MHSRSTKRTRIDYFSFIGIAVALSAIVVGLVKEGGALADLQQLTAAVIVFGGTIGAVMLTTPAATLRGALQQLRGAFFHSDSSSEEVVNEIVAFADQARRRGILSLEHQVLSLPDPFLKKAMMLAVDGANVQQLRSTMELQIQIEEAKGYAEAKVFETAGGYAPTIGIIGAVLGLIQVMKHLDNMSHVGPGIAVAFVATLYGVAAANLLFLPLAGKIKARVQAGVQWNELMLEGVAGIVEGTHPNLIRMKIDGHLSPATRVTFNETTGKHNGVHAA